MVNGGANVTLFTAATCCNVIYMNRSNIVFLNIEGKTPKLMQQKRFLNLVNLVFIYANICKLTILCIKPCFKHILKDFLLNDQNAFPSISARRVSAGFSGSLVVSSTLKQKILKGSFGKK